jgi:hypothetical protein
VCLGDLEKPFLLAIEGLVSLCHVNVLLMLVYRCLLYLWPWNSCYWSCEYHPCPQIETALTLKQAERGVVNKGDEVEIVGLGSTLKTTLTGIGALHLHAGFFLG